MLAYKICDPSHLIRSTKSENTMKLIYISINQTENGQIEKKINHKKKSKEKYQLKK